MVVGSVLSNQTDHILAKPSHVLGDGEGEVAEGVHLAVNHMRGNSLCEPLNISWIGKSVCVTLEQGNRQTVVFNRNLWWCELAVSLYVLLWPIIEHREVFSQNVLGKISQILVGATSGEIYEEFR